MAIDTYGWLMAGGAKGDPFDRHLFACAIAVAVDDRDTPLAVSLGLSAESLAALIGRYFPQAFSLLIGLAVSADGSHAKSIEEPDLRALLLDNRSQGSLEEEWLAHIIARRSLRPNFLWQDLGLTGRADVNILMMRHFQPLAERNVQDMKWKKFFYREMCRAEGLDNCKSPICSQCADHAACFGAEEGRSLMQGEGRPLL